MVLIYPVKKQKYSYFLYVIVSIIFAKAPFPNTFALVITGSNNIYNAVINDNISALKPKYCSNIGSITKIPPPGMPATENLASRAICERLGMKLEGIISNAENLNGRIVDHAIYGLHRI